ncbi:hypothetical protein [Calorimonas adulescens]|jgi:hypothetical protein|uniref:Uncharacterized protein n=1 Tax=Calorimonas adulescens TaxID=2606906 RepID=A0A5D8QGN5_9THEO|nr:hypothetical protein [Calorimonas adulescens]TZE82683.1 hypothetical protein FWJ32_03525 [Calorimonas adulescens]
MTDQKDLSRKNKRSITPENAFGEFVPTLHKWVMPNVMRQRAKYMKEISAEKNPGADADTKA